jgi:hypothetical protein
LMDIVPNAPMDPRHRWFVVVSHPFGGRVEHKMTHTPMFFHGFFPRFPNRLGLRARLAIPWNPCEACMQIIPEMPRLMDICRPEAGVTFLDFMVKLRERFFFKKSFFPYHGLCRVCLGFLWIFFWNQWMDEIGRIVSYWFILYHLYRLTARIE